MPPGLQSSGDTLDHPQASFGRWFACQTEGGPARLVHRHAFRNELVPAKQAMDQFACLTIILETARVTPRLVVEHNYLRATADFFVVAKALALAANRAAVHPGPNTLW